VQDAARKRILILGEFGAFGRHLGRALARLEGIELVLASREPGRLAAFAGTLGARTVSVDPAHDGGLREVLRGSFAAVNTFGPFRADDFTVANACAELGVHYIDPADTRAHVSGIERLERRAAANGALIVSGAGATPAVSAALVDLGQEDFDRVSEIHTFVAPGRQGRRNLATAHAILGYLGDPIRIKERGRWRHVYGFRRAQTVRLPEPLRRRRGYLCDLPDLDLFPRRYGAQTVTARVATPSALFSAGISTAAWLKRRNMVRDLARTARALLRVSQVFGTTAEAGAALRVEVCGQRSGRAAVQVLTLLARSDNGLPVAVAPITALVRRWLADPPRAGGAGACVGLLDWEALRAELIADGADVVLIRSWEDAPAG
jgi:short subunit dehydrogenase-like uncharacterized protein